MADPSWNQPALQLHTWLFTLFTGSEQEVQLLEELSQVPHYTSHTAQSAVPLSKNPLAHLQEESLILFTKSEQTVQLSEDPEHSPH